ncbi:MAG: hypothetical protein WAM96_18315 [Candidatus Acidiferrales bacterium]
MRKAREFLRTPFAHQGRIKRHGIDCVGLPILVASELGLIDTSGSPFTPTMYGNYPRQPSSDIVLEACRRHLIEKKIEDMRPGDVLAILNPRWICHSAIVGEFRGALTLIQAYGTGNIRKPAPRGTEMVVEHGIDFKWRRRIRGCFSYPGVED